MATARVLVVDDEPRLLNAYTRVLGRHGYDVLPASGPRQALEIVRGQPPIDAVITDLQMPDMRGTDLVREIAELSPETGCVLVTGSVIVSADMPVGLPLLRKPVPTPDLIAAVQCAVARSAELRARFRKSAERSAELQKESKRLISECRDVRRKLADAISESRLRLALAQRNPNPKLK